MTIRDGAARELGLFLRARREQLSPAQLELPPGARHRRTPGLRREEVADLAGVSVDYVVRIEQGRGPRPSVGPDRPPDRYPPGTGVRTSASPMRTRRLGG